MKAFTHLHVHTQYSLLDGQASIDGLIEKAQKDGMKALAMTDHGNMFGVKEFFNKIKKKNSKHTGIIKDCEKELLQLQNKTSPNNEDDERIAKLAHKIKEEEQQLFKPIIGCECYCARNGRHVKEGKENQSGWHIILLAKNLQGYKNLIKMVSNSWTEGFYSRPRIDKELLEKYHEGVIASSACLAGEIPRHIQAGDMQKAEASALWFKNLFGDDFYLELMRHETHNANAAQDVYPRQVEINKALIEIGRKHNIKLIATNDVHFLNEEDADAHEILLCLSTGKTLNDTDRMRYTRQEWFKTAAEMNAIFHDLPEALDNTMDIANKVEFYNIDSPALMPFFEIDAAFGTEEAYREKYDEKALIEEFKGEKNYIRLGGYDKALRIKLEADYLTHLTYERAPARYGSELTDELRERIDFELQTMKSMGFPGYFLIVQDFIQTARRIGVSVGPGRGSAAGSVVAYCLGITDIDPLKYDLLFERFLNPDRISMPDIDIDFDDDGRGEVLKWVTDKYGADRVAHIITYGTMATKSAIADVARVLNLGLSESNRLKKLVPDRMPAGSDGKPAKQTVANCVKYDSAFKAEAESKVNPLIRETLKFAGQLEGTVRNTGVHACGIIIGRQPISDIVPVATAEDKSSGEKDKKLLVTQYEGTVIEETGLIKMDFLGLRTLSIIKEALANIKQTTGKEIDIDHIDIEDKDTYKLFCEGRTTATFQFESPGMQKYLKDLQPSKFEDLIAMNALYRPGPMDYIPSFIERKHGRAKIEYDIPVMKRYLEDTYGVTVYQEQVMLLSRLLADFTRGESDTLRKAMGKKDIDKMNELKDKFLTQGVELKGHNSKVLEKIWADWEKFAKYAFNKSHATCYSWIAFQTAYLKAHYPSEYMAAVLSRNLSNIKEITKLMDECRSMELQVLGPDVNESFVKFGVNKKGDIRFGLVAVKGVGEGAVQNIIDEREKNGAYKDIYDFVERVDMTKCNKRVFESLALSGGFDNLGLGREAFVATNEKGDTFIEVLMRYGTKYQLDSQTASNSLFGGDQAVIISKPAPHKCEQWNDLDRLNKEKDLIGIYLSAHPLDDYRIALTHVCNTGMADVKDKSALRGRDLMMGGIVTAIRDGRTKQGKPYSILTLEDFTGSGEIALFGKDFETYATFGRIGLYLLIRGRVDSGQWGKDDYFRIHSITQLQDEKDKLIQSFGISLSINDLKDTTIADLEAILKNDKSKKTKDSKTGGSARLYFTLTDEERNVSVKMASMKGGVDVTKTLLETLGHIHHLDLYLNDKKIETAIKQEEFSEDEAGNTSNEYIDN